MINEKRLFKLLPYFFENPQSVLVEIAQNAQRAKAKKLEISVTGKTLTAKDNGKGTKNASALLTLAESDWKPEIGMQNPAGWGMFFLICISTSVEFKSLFGTIKVESERFLNDSKYRESIKPTGKPCQGFSVVAQLKETFEIRNKNLWMLGFFDFPIYVNKKEVKKIKPSDLIKESIVETYEGNKVYISKNMSYTPRERMLVIWYGIPIADETYEYFEPNVIIDVRTGSPVNPVLPYRVAVKKDKQFTCLWEYVQSKYSDWAIKKINTAKKEDYGYDLKKIIDNVSMFTPHRVNELKLFYVEAEEPYYRDDVNGNKSYSMFVTPHTNIVSQSLKLTVDGKRVKEGDDEDEMVVLPEKTVTTVSAKKAHPDWLEIKNEVVNIAIKTQGAPCEAENFTWQGTSLLDVKAVAIGSSWNVKFYSNKPEDIWEISDPAFLSFRYCEDSDTYETQEYDWEKELKVGISQITGKYSAYDLLGKIAFAAQVAVSNISQIAFDGKILTVGTVEKNVSLSIT